MTFLTWILAGVLAGVLAGWVMKRGGYGLSWDITLGPGGGEGEGRNRHWRSHRDEGRGAGRERVRPDRHRRQAHGDAQAEKHVGQPDGAAARGEASLYRCPGTAHQARGRADRADPQIRHVRK